MVAGVVAELGGSWDRWEAELDLPRLAGLQGHMRQYPPVQAMVQAYLGIEGVAPGETDQSDDEIEADLKGLQMMGLA